METNDMHVSALFRYPVKSMQGERLDAASIGSHGIVGDRQWGLLDLDTGLMLTARREPALLFARARLLCPPDVHDTELGPPGFETTVQIELPDGTITDDDATLSAWLGRPVELRRADPDTAMTYEIAVDVEEEDPAPWVQWTGPRGSFHDSTKAQVSLVAEGSMRQWDVRRFRPNVVVTGEDGDEDALVGQHVQIGTATFVVRAQIGRCVMTTRPQPASDAGAGLERDLSVLKTINAERGTLLAIAMMVERTGTVTLGDRVRTVASSSAASAARMA